MLVGVEGRYESPLEDADLEVIRWARIEAVKVSVLNNLNGVFTVFNPPTDRQYATKVQRAYCQGIRHFILHKQPNSMDYGYEEWWRTGQDFSEWWVDCVSRLRDRFPDIKMGLPAMKSGADNNLAQADSWDFFTQCESALDSADFYELSMRWTSWREMRQQLWRLDSYQLHYDKPIIITFSNPNSATPKSEKGDQYLSFYKELKGRDNIWAAFSFCISSPLKHHMFETWRGEQTGKPSIIAEIVKNRDF